MSVRFASSHVLVTGAGSGIGRETAIAFAKQGAVISVVDIDRQAAMLTAGMIGEVGGRSNAFYADVGKERDVEDVFAGAREASGLVSILVNNVGIEISGPIASFSTADYDRTFNVNTRSVFLCTRAVIPQMTLRGGGAIVNLASVASFRTWPGDGVYSASKAAVLALTKAFAIELAASNIRVNAVAPAIIDTPMTDRAVAHESDRNEAKRRKGLIHPIPRLGQPREVANAIMFLASDDASFTTGGCITIDGGLLS